MNLSNCTFSGAKAPKDVLDEYLKLDAHGEFLTSKGWSHLKRLTNWNDAPGWDFIVRIKGYRVNSYEKGKESASFQVIYDVLGREIDGKLHEDLKQEVQLFKLIKIDGDYKIIEPQIPPHVLSQIASNNALGR